MRLKRQYYTQYVNYINITWTKTKHCIMLQSDKWRPARVERWMKNTVCGKRHVVSIYNCTLCYCCWILSQKTLPAKENYYINFIFFFRVQIHTDAVRKQNKWWAAVVILYRIGLKPSKSHYFQFMEKQTLRICTIMLKMIVLQCNENYECAFGGFSWSWCRYSFMHVVFSW